MVLGFFVGNMMSPLSVSNSYNTELSNHLPADIHRTGILSMVGNKENEAVKPNMAGTSPLLENVENEYTVAAEWRNQTEAATVSVR